MSVIGLDLGTSGVRAVAFAESGAVLGSATAPLELLRDGTGRAELDAFSLIEAAERVVRDAAVAATAAGDAPGALGFSVLGEAVVPVDAHGGPMARIAVSMDGRGAPAARAIGERVGAERFQQITGQPLHGMFSVFKIMAGGDGWADAAGFRCVGDLLAERWTGVPGIDLSQAARTGLLDVDSGEWSEELLAAVAIDAPWLRRDRLPVPFPAGAVIGGLAEESAIRLGMPAGTPIVAGAHDQAAAYLGADGRPGGRAVIALGSSDCLTVGTPDRLAGLDDTGFAGYRVDDGLWITLAGTAAGGWALEWLAGMLRREVGDVFGAIAEEPPALLVLPYLAGSGTLDNDPDARGVIHGLTLDTGVPELARAFIESAGFEFYKIAAAFRARGVGLGELNVTGTGASNAAALAARADASGLELTPVTSDASVRGAAMFALRALGGGPAALRAPADEERTARPHPETAPWYDLQRAAYVDLYRATRAVASHLDISAQPHQKEKNT
ncbi:FGGY-family carbohydrate kinase [Microbacterium resistens]|uniref:FGGY-family carbohydrate kinase n=1 Tax=Microbacterium resistens TaxID=156977 RepID=UPI00082C901E|nr:FGGY family carbohydrate kinase [Microbacterium resistens]